jgi:hypothetical protein
MLKRKNGARKPLGISQRELKGLCVAVICALTVMNLARRIERETSLGWWRAWFMVCKGYS